MKILTCVILGLVILSPLHIFAEGNSFWTEGKIGSCLDMSKIDHAEVPISPSLRITDHITIELWIKPTAINWQGVMSKGFNGYPKDRDWELTVGDKDRKFHFSFSNDGVKRYTISASFTIGEWTHLVITFDGEMGKIYANGKLIESVKAPGKLYTSTRSLYIGKLRDTTHPFSGLIDEVRIYHRVLSKEEVVSRYQGKEVDRSELVLDLPMNEGEGTILHDKSGNNNNAVVYGITKPKAKEEGYWTKGKFGSALRCDGVYVEIPSSNSLSISDKISIEAWIKLLEVPCPTLNPLGTVLVKLPTDWRLAFHGSCIALLSAKGKDMYVVPSKKVTWKAGQWYHVAAVYDGQLMKIYIDGKLDNKVSKGRFSIPTSGQPLRIGKWTDNAPRYFPGVIDEVRVYHRVLSEEEIAKRYEGKEIDCTGLVLDLPMNEGKGTVVYDKSGHHNNGLIMGDVMSGRRAANSRLWKKLHSLKADRELKEIEKQLAQGNQIPEGIKKDIEKKMENLRRELSDLKLNIKGLGNISNREKWKKQYNSVFQKIEEIESRLASLKGETKLINIGYLTAREIGIKDSKYGVAIATPMEKILRDGSNLIFSLKNASLSLSRNEHEAIQIVLFPLGEELKDVKVEVSDLVQSDTKITISKNNIRIYFVGYVGAVKGGYAGGYMFKVDPTDKSVKYLPDPLLERESVDVKKGQVQPVWIDVYAPPNAPAGEYKGKISIKANGLKAINIPLSVKVWDFCLPEKFSLYTHFQVAPDIVADFLSEHRISTGHPAHSVLPRGPKEFSEIQPIIEKRLKKYFEWGGTQFLMEMPVFEIVHAPVNSPANKDVKNFTSAQKEYIKRFYRDFAAYLKKKGLLDKAYVWVWDEPKKKDIANVKELCSLIKEANPKIRTLASFTDEVPSELFGLLDIWCPQIDNFDKHQEILKERQKVGDEIWPFVACNPPHKYPSFAFIDPEHKLIEARLLLGWIAWKYDMQGFLYWWTCGWTGSFIQDKRTTICYWTEWKSVWPAGDGVLTYPSEPGFARFNCKPLSSLRLEAIRDGLEDYEYLVLLRQKIDELKKRGGFENLVKESERLLIVPEDIVTSLISYTDDPSKIYKQRELIALQIEKINKILGK
ncbi:DUF4091 domain-containing protein [Candidatus Calescamantes bacterium]|nr:DUF4091 domain-containing protein [Candidatus Calescamantes bacterium]